MRARAPIAQPRGASRRGIARVLLGSVAERIVRLSSIPVLTVHPTAHAETVASAA